MTREQLSDWQGIGLAAANSTLAMELAEREREVVRVLAVVDDHPDMRALLRLLLRPERGFDVMAEAASAAEALELVCTNCGPGAIVLDQNLEGPLTGLELAPLLKRKAPHARIVLFTAHDLASEAEANPAVDGFVRKDRVGDLPGVLRTLLENAPAPDY